MRPGWTPRDSASAVPRSLTIETSISSASSQVAKTDSPTAAQGEQAGADDRQGDVHERPRPSRDAADQLGHIVVGERLGPGQLVAGAVATRQGGGDALRRVPGPDRLEASPALAGHRHHRQEGEAPQQGDPGVAVVVDDRGGEDRRLAAGRSRPPARPATSRGRSACAARAARRAR